MARCKYCNKSGFFLSVDSSGLCKICSRNIALEISQKIRIINESLNIVRNSKKIETIASRMDVVIKFTEDFLIYESRDIKVTDEKPSTLLNNYKEYRERLILENLNKEIEDLTIKVDTSQSVKVKANTLSKFLLRVNEYDKLSNKKHELKTLENKIKNAMNKIQFEGYVDEAKKSEFKRNNKKALEQYYDALYFMKQVNIEDLTQKEEIKDIEKKILDLGGELR